MTGCPADLMTTVLDLEQLAENANRELAEAPAHEVLGWASEMFGDRFAIAASMGDTVLTHLASRVQPGIDVLFVETGYHFVETIGTRDAVAATYPVRVLDVTPTFSVAEQDRLYGPRLHDRDPDRCCAMRKVAPLDRALRDYDAWASGLRRDEAPTRADAPVVGWDAKRRKVKVNPLARWTQADVDAYIAEHNVLVNPLLLDGYASIGCAPCTRRTPPGENLRAGRWPGSGKTECGING
jgi:phosphoadenosine phosphosulfate reductase